MSLVWAEGIFLSHFYKTPTRPRAKRSNREAQIQRALVQHIELRRAPNVYWTATANGGKRDPISGRMLKLSGVRAGVPDFLFCVNGEFFGLELKAEGGRPSLNQLEHLDEIRNAGGYAVVAEGLDEAIRILEIWNVITKGGARVDIGKVDGGENRTSPPAGGGKENDERDRRGVGGDEERDHRALPSPGHPAHFRQIPSIDRNPDAQTKSREAGR